jgi:hypothetical protein
LGFPGEQIFFAQGVAAAIAFMLQACHRAHTGAQEYRVFAEFFRKRVNLFVNFGEFFGLGRFFKKVELTAGFRGKVEQSDSGGPVKSFWFRYLGKKLFGQTDNFVRNVYRPIQLYFGSGITEILGFQKKGELFGAKAVAARFNAGVFDVFRQLGKDKIKVKRGRRESPGFADGPIVVFLFG